MLAILAALGNVVRKKQPCDTTSEASVLLTDGTAIAFTDGNSELDFV